MTDELKPCPFCPDGGDPKHCGGGGIHCVRCSKCGRTNEKLVFTEADGWHYEGFGSGQEAYDDWNTRYKRTCKAVCEQVFAEHVWSCSACGEAFDSIVCIYDFCPHCGAEIVQEEING